MNTQIRIATLALAGSLVACDSKPGDVVAIDATGVMTAQVYLDRDGNGAPTAGVDPAMPGVRITLGQGASAFSTVTDAQGVGKFSSLPVGRYEISVDRSTIGDTLEVASISTGEVSVGTKEVPSARIALGFPVVTVANARIGSREQTVSLTGVALHNSNLFADSTLSVADATGAIRATHLAPRYGVAAGDSVRLVGRLRTAGGIRVISDPAAYVMARASVPAAVIVTAATASSAARNALDASLVQLRGGVIGEVRTDVIGNVHLTVNDATGSLTVILDRAIRFTTEIPLIPGVGIDVTGVLVPNAASSTWSLKPRSFQDLELQVPQVTIARARVMAMGQLASLVGVALHTGNLYSDSTVHIVDATGALRVTQLPPRISIAAGDSVRLVGRIRTERGVHVLTEPTVVALGRTELPRPTVVSTAATKTASAGRLDAALVQIRNALVVDVQSTATDDVRLRVDDGSGQAEVRLDRGARITSDNPIVPGAIATVTGVLVPKESGGSEWVLKPRASQDLDVRLPQLTTVGIRGATQGQVVSLTGIALNGWATFNDATIHIADAAGTIRAVGVRSPYVLAGDSVRLTGIVGLRDGQPVIQEAVPTILGKAMLPAPVPVRSGVAAGASGGSLDAALVHVTGVTVDSVAIVNRDYVLRANDGSGTLIVNIGASTNISGASYPKGSVIDVTGLLIPLPGGQIWVLRPRSAADVSAR